MRILSLFSGIGAFEKALFNLGYPFEVVRAIEYDKYAIRSYNAIHGTNFPSTDIRDVVAAELPDFDFMTYGFPCQDISVAGKMKGIIEGETRSGLLFDAMKILKEKMPKFAIAENVKNLVGEQFRPDFVRWLLEMSELGYNNYWDVLNSKDYRVPQNRERVFVVSIRKDLDPCKFMMGGFEFPLPIKSNIRLKDVLESEVDEKYYLSDKMLSFFLENDKKMREKGNGFKFEPISEPYDKNAKTVTTHAGSRMDDNFIQDYCVPVLTPDRTEKRQNGRRFKEDGDPSFTLTSQDRHGVMVAEATKKGYAIATENDSINIAFPEPETRRGRVQKGLAGTLETSCNQAVIVGQLEIKGNDQIRRVYSPDGISPTLMTMQGGNQEPKIQVVNVSNTVNVRKNTVNVNDLKTLLRSHKNKPNKEIAELLNKPITLVEHWFRKDDCFSIPDADVWMQLKNLLCIETDEFDKGIMEFEERDGVYEKANRCYHEDGIAPTLTKTTADENIISNYRIRKLTPKECFRLQGFSDEDFQKCREAGISDSQLYKQAGNSITTNVVYAIFRELKEYCPQLFD